MNRGLDVNGGFGRIEFPGWLVWIADRHPRVVNDVGVFINALGLLRFEIDWVGTDEESLRGLALQGVDFARGGGRAALNGKGGAHVVESAASGGQFIKSDGGFEVLGEVIELSVASGYDDLGSFVGLDVIGAQAGVLVADIHVTIGVVNLADLALLFRFQGGFGAGGGGRVFGERLGLFLLRSWLRRACGALRAREARIREQKRQQQWEKNVSAKRLQDRRFRHAS